MIKIKIQFLGRNSCQAKLGIYVCSRCCKTFQDSEENFGKYLNSLQVPGGSSRDQVKLMFIISSLTYYLFILCTSIYAKESFSKVPWTVL